MNLSFLIICNSQHQLEKGLYLKKMLKQNVDVACLKFHPNDFFEKKDFYCVDSINDLIKKNNSYDRFIFFSIIPSKLSFKYLRSLRKSKKKIILIQETHQLSMSNSVINSIMLSPDLIIAASDREKELMVKNNFFKENTIISPGWIFQEKFHKFVQQELLQNNKYNKKDYILLVFSAPQIITSSSQETYQKRKEIIRWIQDKNPNEQILIKLHPLEDINMFLKSVKFDKDPCLKIAPNTSNVYTLGKDAKSIFISDKTQAFIDFVNFDQEITIYSLGNLNFISSFLDQNIDSENYKNISFYRLNKAKGFLKLFSSIHLKSEDNALLTSLKSISNPLLEINSIANDEIAIWEYVYGKCNKRNSKKLKLIKQILKLSELSKSSESEIQTISLKTSITIYLLNKIIYGSIIHEIQIKDILSNFITPNFVQYFYLETQRLKFFLNHMRIKIEMQKDAIEVFNNSLEISSEKSGLFKLIIRIESQVNTCTINFIRTPIYMILDFLLVCAIRMKR